MHKALIRQKGLASTVEKNKSKTKHCSSLTQQVIKAKLGRIKQVPNNLTASHNKYQEYFIRIKNSQHTRQNSQCQALVKKITTHAQLGDKSIN